MASDYRLPAVSGIEVYRQDIVVCRQGDNGLVRCSSSTRQDVKEFSEESRKRLAFVACNTAVCFRTMVTLTYPAAFPADGDIVKRHLHAFLAWMRRRWSGLSYLWFLEFQKRGAPHIHVLLSINRRIADIQAVAESWYKIVDSGDYRHRQAGTRTETIRKQDGAKRYAVKYAFKCKQKAIPKGYYNVGRLWGHSKDVCPKAEHTIPCDEQSIRTILSEWRYMPSVDYPLYRVLYGASEIWNDAMKDVDL